MSSGKQHQAPAGSPEARLATISVSVTDEIMGALKAAVQQKKSEGLSWSINREAWERLSYTFKLTGPEGSIDPHVELLKSQGNRRITELTLLSLIQASERFEGFSYPGSLRNALSGEASGYTKRGIEAARNLSGELDIDLLFRPVGDLLDLRSRNSEALETLVMQTAANVADADYEPLKALSNPDALSIIDELFDELRKYLAQLETDGTPSGIAKMRAQAEVLGRFTALQVLASNQVLSAYLGDWNQVISRHVDQLEPFFEEPDFQTRIADTAELAMDDLTPIDEVRKLATVRYKALSRNVTERIEAVFDLNRAE